MRGAKKGKEAHRADGESKASSGFPSADTRSSLKVSEGLRGECLPRTIEYSLNRTLLAGGDELGSY